MTVIELRIESLARARIVLEPGSGGARAHLRIETAGAVPDAAPSTHDVPLTVLNEVLALAWNVTVSAMPAEGAMGLDGVTYHLTIANGGARATYSWWVNPPKGWEGLAEIANRLLELARPHVRGYTLTLGP